MVGFCLMTISRVTIVLFYLPGNLVDKWDITQHGVMGWFAALHNQRLVEQQEGRKVLICAQEKQGEGLALDTLPLHQLTSNAGIFQHTILQESNISPFFET